MEVDEFLDRVAESIQVYTQKAKDSERALTELKERLRDYETLKGSLQEALLMAQKTAEERIRNATTAADGIVNDARLRAERIVKEAEMSVVEFGNELNTLKELRSSGFSRLKGLLNEIAEVIEKAEGGEKLHLPDFTTELIRKSEISKAGASSSGDGEPKKLDLSDTLNALGLDPGLLLHNPVSSLDSHEM